MCVNIYGLVRLARMVYLWRYPPSPPLGLTIYICMHIYTYINIYIHIYIGPAPAGWVYAVLADDAASAGVNPSVALLVYLWPYPPHTHIRAI